MSSPTIDLPHMLKRLHLPTIARNLDEVETQAAKEGLGIREALAILCAHEVANRNNTRIAKAVRRARFPFVKTMEEFDFTFATGLRRDLLAPYLCHVFVTEGRNVIFNGKSGRGKTALSRASPNSACFQKNLFLRVCFVLCLIYNFNNWCVRTSLTVLVD